MWIRVGAAALCFAAIMGFSRIAYGVLVPAMRASLGGDFSLYGAIGGANMVGYLAGSLLTTRLARRPDRSRSNALALGAMCIAMAACGFVNGPLVLGALRFVIGLASGIALALTLALAVERVPPERRGVAAAIVWGGACAGIALVGAVSGLAASAPSAWRVEWIAMGVLGGVTAAIFAAMTAASNASEKRPRDDGTPIGLFVRSRYRALAISYFCYGFGYICVVTFFGAALSHVRGMQAGVTWTVLGLVGLVGVVLWGPLVDRMRSGVPVALACGCCALGACIIALGTGASAIAGALAIGVSFIGVPAMVGALLHQREKPERYPRAFASITVMLGCGQIVGPLVGGAVADRFGATAAVVVGGSALALAAVAALFYRQPTPISA